MNQHEGDPKQQKSDDKGIGTEVPSRDRSDKDADLQREGNLGNERNRSERDAGRTPGRDRDSTER